MLMFLGSDDTVSLVATTRGVRDGLFLLDESCTIFTSSILYIYIFLSLLLPLGISPPWKRYTYTRTVSL